MKNLCKFWKYALVLVVSSFFFCEYYIFLNSLDLKLITLHEIPLDHPYRPILEVDNETHFLDADVREFLAKSGNLAFPKRHNAIFLETLLEFDRIWRHQLNRTYMLFGGTLVGAFRHGDQTQWDDDLDLLVDFKYNATLSRDLNNSVFTVNDGVSFRKLYLANNRTQQKPTPWPFIDLFFFTRNGTQTRLSGVSAYRWNVVSTELVFPTGEIAYKEHKFPMPRCPEHVLKATVEKYDSLTCWKLKYNHRLGFSTPSTSIACSKLHRLFQFANYRRINNTHATQFLSKALPPSKIAHMEDENEAWIKGAVLRMDMC